MTLPRQGYNTANTAEGHDNNVDQINTIKQTHKSGDSQSIEKTSGILKFTSKNMQSKKCRMPMHPS